MERENEGDAEYNIKENKKMDEAQEVEEAAGTKRKLNHREGEETLENEVKVFVSGDNTRKSRYAALNSFEESGLPSEVLEHYRILGNPSLIQSHSWPYLLDGRDLIGIAAAGSGKILAYGIPALVHVLRNRQNGTSKTKRTNPLCLILSYTRQRARRIADVLSEPGKSCNVRSVCVRSGSSIAPQISSLKAGVDIVIGTPGRLKDMIEGCVCFLEEVSYVVLDEADKMLDKEHLPKVSSILNQTCRVRQMVMFSATWPISVRHSAQDFFSPNPVKVVVGSEDLFAEHDVSQWVEVLDDEGRVVRLLNLLDACHKPQMNRVLVFVMSNKEAEFVEDVLQNDGWKLVSVHGGKTQIEPRKALTLFEDGICPLMVATDLAVAKLAAEGLDIPNVDVVINYTFPLTIEDYLQRIGRTGRAGKKGTAHTFFSPICKGLAGELTKVLREARQQVPQDLLNLATNVKKELKISASKSTKITFASDED